MPTPRQQKRFTPRQFRSAVRRKHQGKAVMERVNAMLEVFRDLVPCFGLFPPEAPLDVVTDLLTSSTPETLRIRVLLGADYKRARESDESWDLPVHIIRPSRQLLTAADAYQELRRLTNDTTRNVFLVVQVKDDLSIEEDYLLFRHWTAGSSHQRFRLDLPPPHTWLQRIVQATRQPGA